MNGDHFDRQVPRATDRTIAWRPSAFDAGRVAASPARQGRGAVERPAMPLPAMRVVASSRRHATLEIAPLASGMGEVLGASLRCALVKATESSGMEAVAAASGASTGAAVAGTAPCGGRLDPVLAESIEALGLSVRASNCLRACKVQRVADLVQQTETALLRMPNLGRRCLVEIKDALAARGLLLREGPA